VFDRHYPILMNSWRIRRASPRN